MHVDVRMFWLYRVVVTIEKGEKIMKQLFNLEDGLFDFYDGRVTSYVVECRHYFSSFSTISKKLQNKKFFKVKVFQSDNRTSSSNAKKKLGNFRSKN